MALITLEIPPGVYRTGTDLDSKNRWLDASLVRWDQGSLRPIGGWLQRGTETVGAVPRGCHVWTDNNGGRHIVAGTFNSLSHIYQDNVKTSLTPVGLSSGTVGQASNTGYGGADFGEEDYGTERANDSFYAEATSWSMGNFGEYLVACSSEDGKIYEWQLNTSVLPTALANAPVNNDAIVVTEERFIFALGAGNNPRKVQWCDREDNTDWTPTATNQAGDFELTTTGRIQQAVKVRGRTLILTTTDAHVATYSGPPFVYGFERVSGSCGAISRMSAVGIHEGAFWMGNNGFFAYDGSGVRELQCAVHDRVFDNINTSQNSKVFGVHNAQHNEIWWFYSTGTDAEDNDSYVAYDYREDIWTVGKMARSAGFDVGVFSNPIWFGIDGKLYDQETGFSYDSDKPYAETGPLMIGASGEDLMKVTRLIPDVTSLESADVYFTTRLYPTAPATTHGPFDLSNPTSVRFQGRQVRMKIEGQETTNWRAGAMRLEVSPGAKR